MISLSNNKRVDVGLAPMEGVSDFPARLWFYLAGKPNFSGTPFLRLTQDFPTKNIPIAWCPEILDNRIKEAIPYSTIPQFMSPKPEYFTKTAQKILHFSNIIELNCGCPAPKAVGKGAGSSLLIDPDSFSSYLQRIFSEIDPENFAIKLRSGYETSDNHKEIIDIIKQYPIKRVTLHPRTRSQGYKGLAEWQLITELSQSCTSPVYGSGDIKNFQQYSQQMTATPKAKGVIIGRGAIRNPWIFEEIRQQQPIKIKHQVLPLAINTLGLLNELFIKDYDGLVKLIQNDFLNSPPVTRLEHWEVINNELTLLALRSFGQTLDSKVEISRGSLGKTKMIWSYMRSVLPEHYFDPTILRSKSLNELTERIQECSALNSEDLITPQWNQAHDWMYSGEKKNRVT